MAQGKVLAAVRRRLNFSARTWRIIAIVAGIVALAAIILVSSAVSKPKSSQSPTASAVGQQMESETLTDRGFTALSANDTATAETLLQRAVALNPQNKRAATALVRIRQATASETRQSPATGGTSDGGGSTGSSGGTSGSKPKPGPFDAKVNISQLLPVAAAGYVMDAPQIVGSDASVSGDPSSGGVRVIWAVHDRGSAAIASRFISAVSKRAYPKNAKTAVVDGASAYLGTDGRRFATAAYVRGRYVFEVIVSVANAGSDISNVLPTAQAAAALFPDEP